MKRILFSILPVVLCLSTLTAKNLVEMCDNIPGINTVTINQSMMKLVEFPSNTTKPVDLDALSDRLDLVQIINAEDRMKVREVKEQLTKYMSDGTSFQVMMKMKDDDENLTMYQRPIAGDRNEFIVVAEEYNEITIVLLTGTLTISDLANLTDM